jgi:hypothetical protein
MNELVIGLLRYFSLLSHRILSELVLALQNNCFRYARRMHSLVIQVDDLFKRVVLGLVYRLRSFVSKSSRSSRPNLETVSTHHVLQIVEQ